MFYYRNECDYNKIIQKQLFLSYRNFFLRNDAHCLTNIGIKNYRQLIENEYSLILNLN